MTQRNAEMKKTALGCNSRSPQYRTLRTYVRTHVCTYIRMFVRTYERTYVSTYLPVTSYLFFDSNMMCDPPGDPSSKQRTYVHMGVLTFVRTYVRTYVRTNDRPSVHPSIRPSVRPSVRLSVRPFVRTVHMYAVSYTHLTLPTICSV